MQCRTVEEEHEAVGEHTFDKRNDRPLEGSNETAQNRQMLVEYCRTYKYKLMNTFFVKPDEKLVTYREKGKGLGPPWTRGRYEQLDFIIVPRMWQNSVLDVESDSSAKYRVGPLPR